MKRVVKRIRFIVSFILARVVKFGIAVFASYFIYVILHKLELLNVFKMDMIPVINIKHIVCGLGVAIVVFLFKSVTNKISTSISIAIKKYYLSILGAMFLSGIVLWEKFYTSSNYLMILGFELMCLFLLLENEATKIQRYKFDECNDGVSNFTEMPIVGVKGLTTPQKKAYNQIVNLLDKRTREENFNIALLAEWGKGKTSVTDTIIYELQKRNNEEEQYFFLKINSQTFNGTGNIIEYVKEFFYGLFKRYGIIMFEGKSSLAFLTNLSEMLKEQVVISYFINSNMGSEFSDLENERRFFCDRVQLLLKRSGYKNIVFIIDDVDRTENYDRIWQLLGEFSSIRGLITIISLNENVGANNMPVPQDNTEENRAEEPIYQYIDKYIHVRVKIEDVQKIEYEKNIKRQIIEEKNNIYPLKNCYVNLSVPDEQISLFSTVKNYQTVQRGDEITFRQHTRSVLSTIFLEMLEVTEADFGKFFEDTVMEYMYQSKELAPLIHKMLNLVPEKWDMTLWQVRSSWTEIIKDDFFSWTMRLRNIAFQYYHFISGLLDALSLVEDNDVIKTEIMNLSDLYDYYNRTKFPHPGSEWESRHDNPITYCGFDEFIQMIFDKNEYKSIGELLQTYEYDKLKAILIEKIKQISNLLIQVSLLTDFVDYMRKNMNNYRRFKMQLREAEVQELNYLDYLIVEWQPKSQTRKNIDNMRMQIPTLEDVQFEWPTLGAYIDRMIYLRFICNYNPNAFNDINDPRLWLYYGDTRKLIVISYKKDEKRYNIIKDMNGIIVQANEKELTEIISLAETICNL